MELQIVIQGKVPAKSSSRRIIFNRRTSRPMVISSAETKQYETDFARQVLGAWKNKFNPKSRLYCDIKWYTDSYRQDIDSPSKAIFDNLQKCQVIDNDNKIDDMSVIRYIDKLNPRAEITIGEIEWTR